MTFLLKASPSVETAISQLCLLDLLQKMVKLSRASTWPGNKQCSLTEDLLLLFIVLLYYIRLEEEMKFKVNGFFDSK